MTDEAKNLENSNLKALSDKKLADKYDEASQALAYWTDIYWETFIPYGHGMRLFGQVYNEVICPEDPYEFITLLQKDANLATRRNNELQKLSRLILADKRNLELIKNNKLEQFSPEIKNQIKTIVENFAMPSILLRLNMDDSYTARFFEFITGRFSKYKNRKSTNFKDIEAMQEHFLQSFPPGEKRNWASELLELGRHSFLMRDDDNVYLNRFKDIKSSITQEIRQRTQKRHNKDFAQLSKEQLLKLFKDSDFDLPKTDSGRKQETSAKKSFKARKRQVTGQPACPGYITGTARVITSPNQLFSFKEGEIMICDAIGPEMTFAVPLAAGIVERRGGMLIHGAIIAREYGIPCVTGVSEATSIIKTGDKIWVDGYLGIVSIVFPKKYQQ
jgi:pyruvate,water dikinase